MRIIFQLTGVIKSSSVNSKWYKNGKENDIDDFVFQENSKVFSHQFTRTYISFELEKEARN